MALKSVEKVIQKTKKALTCSLLFDITMRSLPDLLLKNLAIFSGRLPVRWPDSFLRIKNKRLMNDIVNPFGVRQAFYLYGMRRRRFQCVFGPICDLDSGPPMNKSLFYPLPDGSGTNSLILEEWKAQLIWAGNPNQKPAVERAWQPALLRLRSSCPILLF